MAGWAAVAAEGVVPAWPVGPWHRPGEERGRAEAVVGDRGTEEAEVAKGAQK